MIAYSYFIIMLAIGLSGPIFLTMISIFLSSGFVIARAMGSMVRYEVR